MPFLFWSFYSFGIQSDRHLLELSPSFQPSPIKGEGTLLFAPFLDEVLECSQDELYGDGVISGKAGSGAGQP